MIINHITPREEDNEVVSLDVYFNGQIAGINFNGTVTLEQGDFESYFNNAEIKKAVKQIVVEKIINGEDPTE